MKRCLDVDRLVTLGAAVDWKVEELLEHLLACSDCREQLGRLATVHDTLNTEEPAPPELVAAVISDMSFRQARRASIGRSLTRSLTALLAGMTTLFSVPLVASGTSPVSFGPVAGAAVAVALAMVWWSTREDGVLQEGTTG